MAPAARQSAPSHEDDDTSRKIIRGVSAALAVAAVFWLPVAFFITNTTPSGQFEESVGYRYFYSMRIAFGAESPWLPQGFFASLCHVLIQYVLHWTGYPSDQLFPRVDLFSLFAVIIPALVGAAAAAWAFISYRYTSTCLALAAILVVMAASDVLPNGWTVLPDYHVWLIPLMFLSLGLHIRAADARDTGQKILIAALVTGIAASLKISFTVFGLAPLTALVINASPPRIRHIAVAVVVSGLIYLLITAAYFRFELRDMIEMFVLTYRFSLNQQSTLPDAPSIMDQIIGNKEIVAVFLVPIVTLTVGIIARRIDLITTAFYGALFVAFSLVRFYSHTMIEVYAYAFVQLSLLAHALEPTGSAAKGRAWQGACAVSVIAIVTSASPAFIQRPASLLAYSRILNSGSEKWRKALANSHQSIWILTTGNGYRPNAIESGLCKGGMDVNRPIWGASPYIANLFPDFHCAVVATGIDPSALSGAVGFYRIPGERPDDAIRRVEAFFAISLARHTCTEWPAGEAAFVSCVRGE